MKINMKLKTTLHIIEKAPDYFGITLLLVMLAVVAIGVFYRIVLERPILWVNEAARYLMVWLVFIGASIGVKLGDHIAIDLLIERVPAKLSPFVDFLIRGSMLLFSIIVLYWSLIYVSGIYAESTVLRISLKWVYASLPVSMILISIYLIRQIMDNVNALIKQ